MTNKQIYFVPPPFINSTYEYQNVNNDQRLRDDVTSFFYKKIIKWIKTYKEFNHLKNKLSILESSNGKKIIYRILKEYIKNTNINWYDVRDNYSTIKDYLRYKISKI